MFELQYSTEFTSWFTYMHACSQVQCPFQTTNLKRKRLVLPFLLSHVVLGLLRKF